MNEHGYIIPLKALQKFISGRTENGFESDSKLMEDVRRELDVIARRIGNIIAAHEEVMKLPLDVMFKISFLHLQYYLLSSLCYAIARTTNRWRHRLKVDQLTRIEDTLPRLIQETRGITKYISFYVILSERPLTNMQLAICKKNYAFPTDVRIVDWFMAGKFFHLPETQKRMGAFQKLAYAEQLTRDNGGKRPVL